MTNMTKKFRTLLIVCVLSTISAFAQTTDVQAVQILERAIATAGGRLACSQMNSFRASGRFVLYSRGAIMQEGNASLMGIGLTKFRLRADFGTQIRTFGWQNGRGAVSLRAGQTDPLGAHNVAVLEGMTIPARKIIALQGDLLRSVQLVETTSLNNRPVYRVRIVRRAKDRIEQAAIGRPFLTMDVLVDQQTFAISAIEDEIHPNTNTHDSFTHRILYGDYRSVAGVEIPFSVLEEIGEQPTWGLAIRSFEANVAIADSEFLLQ